MCGCSLVHSYWLKDMHGLEGFIVFVVKLSLKAWTTETDRVLVRFLTWHYCSNLLHLKSMTAKCLRPPVRNWHLIFSTSQRNLWNLLFRCYRSAWCKDKNCAKIREKGLENPPKRVVVDLKDIWNKTFDEFASMNSLILIHRLGLPISFMEIEQASL